MSYCYYKEDHRAKICRARVHRGRAVSELPVSEPTVSESTAPCQSSLCQSSPCQNPPCRARAHRVRAPRRGFVCARLLAKMQPRKVTGIPGKKGFALPLFLVTPVRFCGPVFEPVFGTKVDRPNWLFLSCFLQGVLLKMGARR